MLSHFFIPYFSAKVETLETRFPSLSASSLLWRLIKISSEKSVSSKTEHRKRAYLTASVLYFSASCIGSITLPSDLDIFCPLRFRYPCTRSLPGSLYPADIRRAGQITEWNQFIPLPIT